MPVKRIHNDNRLVAPDGQPSSLSPALYDYVRSSGFIARHGDWRKPGYRGLVLDSHGEPKVLWHGSPVKFEAFDMSHVGDNTGLGTYTDHMTGAEIPDDSTGALFFTDDRMQAISYGFLGWTNRLSEVYNGIGRVMLAMRGINEGKVLETIGVLKGFDVELGGILKDVELGRSRPVSSLSVEVKEGIWKALKEYRDEVIQEKYHTGFSNSVGSPISNMLHNTIRQVEYFRYFMENFDRVRRNDLTVGTEDFGMRAGENCTYCFENYSVQFFDSRCKYHDGVSVFVDCDNGSRIRMVMPDGSRLFADELSDEAAAAVLGEIRDGLNATIADVNGTLERTGFLEHTYLYPAFLRMEKPLEHDYRGSSFPDKYLLNERYSTAYVAARQNARARRDGNDGVIYRRVVDPFQADTYGVFSVGQIDVIPASMMRREDMDLRMLPVMDPVVVRPVGAVKRSAAAVDVKDSEKKEKKGYRFGI